MHQPAFTPFGPETVDQDSAPGEPLLEGNRADVFEQTEEVLAALTDVLGHAQDHINLDAALLQVPHLSEAVVACLGEQCHKGVRVQVMAQPRDMTGAVKALARLCEAGVTLNEERPRRGMRGWLERQVRHVTHRQLAVVDGQLAWCGPGLQDNGPCAAGPHVCVRGPVVQRLQRLFLESWHASGSHVQLPPANYFAPMPLAGSLRMGVSVPSDEGSVVLSEGGSLVDAVGNARLSVFIGTAGQAPARALLKAVTSAASRGVEVSVLLPGHAMSDWTWRRRCAALLRGGACVYVTDGPCPFPMHCVVDGAWSHLALRSRAAWPMAATVSEELTVHGEAFAQALEAACLRNAGTRIAVGAHHVSARRWWRGSTSTGS